MSDLLQLCDVSLRFGALVVADRVCLELPRGQALGIIGPNGAGKTTLFNLISGNLRPRSGTIRLEGRDLTPMSVQARCAAGIGRTWQIPHPFARMTVYENALVGAVFGAGLRDRDAARRAGEVLERTGLSDKAERLAGSLPLLDRKRLELARALATEPALLLLDEIAGGLSEHETPALIGTIRSLREDGVAILWIEHVVHALMAVVDRLLVLNFGAVVMQGEPAAVMASDEVRAIYMGMEVR
jgi:branched-chain amino acid transport system ATP-binding protein